MKFTARRLSPSMNLKTRIWTKDEVKVSSETSDSYKVVKKKVVKKSKKRNKTGWDAPKKFPKKPGFAAFEVRIHAVTSHKLSV